jgi:uncharacterized protein
MLADGSKLRDVSVLADEGAVLPVELPVSELPRLLPELTAADGVVHGELGFGREHGEPVVDVTLDVTVTLTCQRCMQPMAQHVATRSRVWLPADEVAAARLPAELETMLAPEGRARVADIVGEELLLALPLAPRHEDDSECDEHEARTQPAELAEGTPRRPFAGLAQLMGRDAGPGDISAERPAKAPRTRR